MSSKFKFYLTLCLLNLIFNFIILKNWSLNYMNAENVNFKMHEIRGGL